MKVGFYKSDMISVKEESVEDAAKDFAEEHHQIDEQSDMDFEVYVEDDDGKMHVVKMFTEYDPRFEVESITED